MSLASQMRCYWLQLQWQRWLLSAQRTLSQQQQRQLPAAADDDATFPVVPDVENAAVAASVAVYAVDNPSLSRAVASSRDPG